MLKGTHVFYAVMTNLILFCQFLVWLICILEIWYIANIVKVSWNKNCWCLYAICGAWPACLCVMCASYTVELKMADANYKFLWPFLAVVMICLSIMVMFTVSDFLFDSLYCKYLASKFDCSWVVVLICSVAIVAGYCRQIESAKSVPPCVIWHLKKVWDPVGDFLDLWEYFEVSSMLCHCW